MQRFATYVKTTLLLQLWLSPNGLSETSAQLCSSHRELIEVDSKFMCGYMSGLVQHQFKDN